MSRCCGKGLCSCAPGMRASCRKRFFHSPRSASAEELVARPGRPAAGDGGVSPLPALRDRDASGESDGAAAPLALRRRVVAASLRRLLEPPLHVLWRPAASIGRRHRPPADGDDRHQLDDTLADSAWFHAHRKAPGAR